MYAPSYILYITICCTFIQTYYHKRVCMQNHIDLMLWPFMDFSKLLLITHGFCLHVDFRTWYPQRMWLHHGYHPPGSSSGICTKPGMTWLCPTSENSSGQPDNDRRPTNTPLSGSLPVPGAELRCGASKASQKTEGCQVCSCLLILFPVSSRTILESR